MFPTCGVRRLPVATYGLTCWLCLGSLLGGPLGLPAAACGQEFRVYTRVFHDSPGGLSKAGGTAKSPIVGRSLTFFHAGKAYDHIESAGEVTIFEPAAERFTVLSSAQRMATIVTFEQLEHLLLVAEEQARQYARELEQHAREGSRGTRELIDFQLAPTFAETLLAPERQLVLHSPMYRYRVKVAEGVTPEIVQAYLRYSDWTARLNSVLHPQSFMPRPRLALNEALRRRQLLPVEVELQVETGRGLRLRAEHQMQWQLDSRDRKWMHQWETLLSSPEIKLVRFDEFQQAQLAVTSRR